ncbi:putative phage abortive infection protein [Solitalea lacus]|uniref:putative phage abortive infection protein n=1 Tax=Solitalea lacus TaxID=2911172 RepID=UPI001EDA81E5|nr:putative phage abortive infection protein [Solitalea lacus]UKJ07922.1 putative phage abortive infection protein [Solitalea lacus]
MQKQQIEELLQKLKKLNWLWWLVGLLGFITIIITAIFIYSVSAEFTWGLTGNSKWTETGQIGDFFGGVIGTLVSTMGFIFVYLSFKQQAETLVSQQNAIEKQDKQFEKSQIENRFIELIKLHKENLYDIVYEVDNVIKKDRKAIDFIYSQVEACYKEVAPFFKNCDIHLIFQSEYFNKTASINLKRTGFDLIRLAHIDIAYSIVFFGTSYEDLSALCKLFENKYQSDFISKIASFISLKPYNKNLLRHWSEIKKDPSQTLEELHLINSGRVSISDILFGLEETTPIQDLLNEKPYRKFYGGHQYKLGHYFRHLFQTVKYINDQENLTYGEKYNYIKTLRAQLSTIEQYLIFFNSLSFMGRAWELEYVNKDASDYEINKWLMTKYNFIKNLPDLFLLNEINIKQYYPEIHFEFENEPTEREGLKLKFH